MLNANRCKTCGRNLPYTEAFFYYKDNKLNTSRCKSCVTSFSKLWKKNNREKHNKNVKNYYLKHKDQSLKRTSLWAKNNPQKNREKARKYYELNKEKILNKHKIYYRNNVERFREYSLKRYRKNIEQSRYKNRLNYALNAKAYKDRSKVYRQQHPDQFRFYNRNRRALKYNAGTHTEQQLQDILYLQNNRCLYCNILLDTTVKHLDHFVPLSKGGTNTEENLVWSCYKCNISKKDKLIAEWVNWNGAYPVKWKF